MEKINTFIFPIIITDYIDRCLDTLYKFTPDNFRVIIIDQTFHGMSYLSTDPRVHLYVRPYRNLGFAQGMNTGIRLADTEYVTCANDDIEFVNKRWWDGIIQAFEQDKQVKAVNPMSITEPGWGYGCNKNSKEELVAEKETALKCKFNRAEERFEHLPYKLDYTEEDYDFLLAQKNGAIDGIITWCTTFKRDALEYKGMFDERFFPGGGEDYDIGGRFYSQWWPSGQANPLDRYRMIATSKSWAWHHLSKSRNATVKILPGLRERWNNDHAMWEDKWTHPTLAKFRTDDVKRYPL